MRWLLIALLNFTTAYINIGYENWWSIGIGIVGIIAGTISSIFLLKNLYTTGEIDG